jgi:hypothetical protein
VRWPQQVHAPWRSEGGVHEVHLPARRDGAGSARTREGHTPAAKTANERAAAKIERIILGRGVEADEEAAVESLDLYMAAPSSQLPLLLGEGLSGRSRFRGPDWQRPQRRQPQHDMPNEK